MIVVDTNVVSEVLRVSPSREVLAWLDRTVPTELFLTTITESELLYGVALLPDGNRKSALAAALHDVLARYSSRIVPFDSLAAGEYARVAAARRRAGLGVSVPDMQIAAICAAHRASLATRNTSDFDGCGVRTIDPWTASGG